MVMKMTTTNMRETELKLCLDAQSYAQLQQLLPHHGYLRRQINCFFDSCDFALRSQHWALRLRQDDEHWFLTAKGPSTKNQGISDRIEIEVPCPEAFVQRLKSNSSRLSQIPLEPAKALLELFGDLAIFSYLEFENRRQVLLWEGCHLELDYSTCKGQERFELELELPLAELLVRKSSLEQWLARHGIAAQASNDSKLAWALRQSALGTPS